MAGASSEQRLSHIQTYWTVICTAHEGEGEAAGAAQRQLLQRYRKAIQRYLLGALRDPEAAEELTQEFALRFLTGGFRRADPERGRFRDFVKGVLFHLVADYHRRKQRQPQRLPEEGMELADSDAGPAEAERAFLESWRAELLDRAWKALAELQNQTGQPFFTVLRLRAEQTDLRSAQMAEQLRGPLGKAVTADWVRQTLHRARDRFAELLVDEVAQTLRSPTRAELEQELSDLHLLDYCKPALDRFGTK